MDSREALVALNMVEGVGPVRVRQLMGHFDDAPAVLRATEHRLCQVPGIGPETAHAIAHWEESVDLSSELQRVAQYGCRLVIQEDEEYPPHLKEIYDPPVVLYVKGTLQGTDKNGVALVGSRQTTSYGLEVARKLAYQLAYVGVAVVSGGARGIDTAAHQGALTAKGRSRTGDGDWAETTDSLEYDGVFRHRYQPRRALYGSLVVATAFVGPSPTLSPLDPIRGATAVGHSWLWENLLPLSDRLEVRTGVRTQKRWGTGLDEHVRRIEVGPEAYLRYQRKQTAELSWWTQAELFTDFDDMAHLQGLGTAALQLQLTRIIAVDLRLRAYYEHHPAALPETESRVGYDELGLRQETLIGVVATW